MIHPTLMARIDRLLSGSLCFEQDRHKPYSMVSKLGHMIQMALRLRLFFLSSYRGGLKKTIRVMLSKERMNMDPAGMCL